jgi:hypothetical protein
MLKIPGADGNTYTAVSSTTFKRWRSHVILAYIILSLGMIVGIYAYSTKSKNDLRDEINQYSATACVSGRTTLKKYNDLVQSIVDARQSALALHLSQGKTRDVKLDRVAIARYQKDFLPVPTAKQCERKILK